MMQQLFTCQFCNTKRPLVHHQNEIWFASHVSNEVSNLPGIGSVHVACEGMVRPATESVALSDYPRLMEYLAARDTRPKTTPQKGKEGHSTAHNDAIQRRFEEFHRDNPRVYAALRDKALELKRKGHKTYGMDTLWGWLRWHEDFAVSSSEPFKISNDLRSRYARFIMQKNPELEGFFEVRPLTTTKM